MSVLPTSFNSWFSKRGWTLHPHQRELLETAHQSTLLVAPTGGGKTLAGFLPSLISLSKEPKSGLHTLYISPLKALAADIKRNLMTPVRELGLDIRVEDRTGDTSQSTRLRQRADPPHFLLTTPESLAIMLSYEEAPRIFAGLKRIIIDEIHALAENKRGDQLMLCLSRLTTLAPAASRIGLSATVENPRALGEYLAPQSGTCHLIKADPGPEPDISILQTEQPPPWSGAGGRYAASTVMAEIEKARISLVFINTRAQAELFFQALWSVNSNNLAIGLHHGSLSLDARKRIESAMAAGAIRAVVCTSSLDLGIDWGDVDLVIQIGAPKNIKRLVQRIGRSNHRFDAPSRALLVPANQFEVLECRAALEAVKARELDGDLLSAGGLDVLCQHILLMACSAPLDCDTFYNEVQKAGAYRDLSREDFDACFDFCATGGYALRAYDRWQRLLQRADGLWQLRDPRQARQIRMNVGTIADIETLAVRLRNRRGGAPLGEVEEAFAASLVPGDTFLIGGQTVCYEGLREMTVEVTKQPSRSPKIAVFSGIKMATSVELSKRVLSKISGSETWHTLPDYTRKWLELQRKISVLPKPGSLMAETFLRKERWFFCLYAFAGKNANQTLGLLLTRRMEDAGLDPLGFVATDYAVLIWSLQQVRDIDALVSPEGLRDGLETWLAKNAVMKRTFRNAAVIAGLIERNHPGRRKSGRQATFSSDILYDTLRKYDPDHLLLRITRSEAMRGLVDFVRIEEMFARTSGRVELHHAPHVTPLAAPMLLEMGRVPIFGSASETALAEQADRLMAEAGRT